MRAARQGKRGAQDRTTASSAFSPRRTVGMLLPLAVFLGLATVFVVGLYSGDPSKLPSALIGKPAPNFALPPVDGLLRDGKPVPGLASADLAKGRVNIVNVWASWCIPCHQEHPFLSKLAAQSGAPLYGLNYKDKPAAARRFLGRYGNPFTAVGADSTGAVAIDWGVYGVPETFIVGGDGRILHKHVGPITDDAALNALLALIAKARASS